MVLFLMGDAVAHGLGQWQGETGGKLATHLKRRREKTGEAGEGWSSGGRLMK